MLKLLGDSRRSEILIERTHCVSDATLPHQEKRPCCFRSCKFKYISPVYNSCMTIPWPKMPEAHYCWSLFWSVCTVTGNSGWFHHSVIIGAGLPLHYSSSLCLHRLRCYCTQIGPIFSLQEALRMAYVYESPSGNTRIVSWKHSVLITVYSEAMKGVNGQTRDCAISHYFKAVMYV